MGLGPVVKGDHLQEPAIKDWLSVLTTSLALDLELLHPSKWFPMCYPIQAVPELLQRSQCWKIANQL